MGFFGVTSMRLKVSTVFFISRGYFSLLKGDAISYSVSLLSFSLVGENEVADWNESCSYSGG